MEEEKNYSAVENIAEVKNITEVKNDKPKMTPVYELLETAIKVWWKNLSKFVTVYLWGILFALIPGVIIGAVFLIVYIFYESSNAIAPVPFILLGIICFVFVMYFIVRAYMGMFLLVKKNFEGNELEIFKETKKYFWQYLWLGIITTVFVVLWTLLLIIPGIIFSIFYSFAVYAFFFEDLNGMAAIRRSTALVKNYWWPVFGRFIVVGVVIYIFTLVVSIPLLFTSDKSVFYYIWSTIVQLLNFLVAPISLLYFYQMYQDLVRIKK